MDIRKIKKLIELLDESNLTEIEIVEGEESVRLIRGAPAQPHVVAQAQPVALQSVAPLPAAVSAPVEEDTVNHGENRYL